MKVCVYFEHEVALSSAWSSGIREAYRNHVRALRAAGGSCAWRTSTRRAKHRARREPFSGRSKRTASNGTGRLRGADVAEVWSWALSSWRTDTIPRQRSLPEPEAR